jgi:hypothetical protein
MSKTLDGALVLNIRGGTLPPGRPTVTAAHAKAQTECKEESGKLAPAPTVSNTAPAMTVSNTAVAKLTVIHTAPPSPQAGQQISRIIQLLPEIVNASTEISSLNKQTHSVTIA